MNYAEWKEHRQASFSKLPFKAAFGKQQFKEMMASWGLTTNEEDIKKIRPLVGGAYCLAEDEHLFYEWSEEQERLQKEYLSDEEHLKDALIYEFGNHECGYTMRWKDGVSALFDEDEMKSNKLLQKVLPVAWKEYLNRCEL